MNLKYILLILWMSSILCSPLFSQVKFEREYRVKTNEIPNHALVFIDSCDFSKKIKWYGEESQYGKSFEAKLRENGKRYSIEFDTHGNIQDVEILITKDKIPAGTFQAIQAHLNNVFIRYKITKIQSQWTGERTALVELVRLHKSRMKHKPKFDFTLKYELVVTGKKEKEMKGYEILFDETGIEEETFPIQFNNTDNLEY